MLQTKIADHYDQLPDNDMANPDVRRAYQELSKEVQKQFDALPVKVDVWNREGEPYKSSSEMRRDVLDNNHMWILGTSTDTFGPPGVDFRGHPLLESTGRESNNGYPLVVNDELRAVHDYYAHMLSPTTFGPRGEEAAWKNHLATIDNPWARWALTSETRGQNSWVNFGAHVDPNSKLSERPFARQKAALLPIEDTLTGDDAIDIPTNEFIRTLPDYAKNGSLPQDANDPIANFSPRVPSALREKLIRKDPAYAAMFAEEMKPKKQLAIGQIGDNSKAAEEAPKPRTLVTKNPEGEGKTIERGLNGEETQALENEQQQQMASDLVDNDPERAMAVAMRERQTPKGLLPTFVYFELERRATEAGDEAMIDKLRTSPLAKEVTTAARTVQSFATRDAQSALAKIQEVESAREDAADSRVTGGVDKAKTAFVEKAAPEIKKVVNAIAKARPMSAWNSFLDEIRCK